MEIKRIESGDKAETTDIVIEGSPEQLERIQQLFESGKIKEVLGVAVEDIQLTYPVQESSSVAAKETVNLGQWLEGIIDAAWQSVEEIIGQDRAYQLYAVRDSNATQKKITKAQKIDLALPSHTESLALVVELTSTTTQSRNVFFKLTPTGKKTNLPIGLKAFVVDESGKEAKQIETSKPEKYLNLEIKDVKAGESFSVHIELEEVFLVLNFVA